MNNEELFIYILHIHTHTARLLASFIDALKKVFNTYYSLQTIIMKEKNYYYE